MLTPVFASRLKYTANNPDINSIAIKRLVIVTGSMKPAGSEKQLLNLILGLKSHIPYIYLICFNKGPMYPLYQEAGAITVLIDKGKGAYLSKFKTVWGNLQQAILNIKPDIVMSQLPQTNILTCFVLWRSPIPLILSERGMGKTRPLWEKLLRYLAYRRPNGFVTNTQSICKRIIQRERISNEIVQVINNSIKPQPGSLNSRCIIINRHKLCDDVILLISVGRLVKVKGYDFLLSAFNDAIKTTNFLHLLIVGEGTERQFLEAKIAELGISSKVSLVGSRSDVSDYLSASDIYISSSLSEGQSNSILEAMTAALPIIATKVGGTPEFITNNRTGLLVASRNSSELTQAILRLSSNPKLRTYLGTTAQKSIENGYSINNIADKFLSFFYKTLGNDKFIQ